MTVSRRTRVALAVVALATLVALGAGGWQGAAAKNGGRDLRPLSQLAVPTPPQLDQFVRDDTSLARLGKALFWDMQAGSDGRTACASCHYDAGADNRSRNQLNPRGGSFTVGGPNSQLSAADFPVHTDDVVGSQGVVPSTFKDVLDGDPLDGQAFAGLDKDFQVGGVNVRRTTGRNAPTATNAVFNFRQFWDGRAQNDFNGVNPFGSRDPDARVGRASPAGAVDKVTVSLSNSSLGAQSTGPPGNPVEMSADGRTLSDIGRKLLTLRPLGAQEVSTRDSVLGSTVSANGRGLSISYDELIRKAFLPEWWNSESRLAAANGRSYPLMQFNFPLFWGLAIQAYEATLVSDQAPVDRFLSGDIGALTETEQRGMGVFSGKGDCTECHTGPAFTSATVADVVAGGGIIADGAGPHDAGFFNIGVRPTASDPGSAGSDPFGKPLSMTLLGGQASNGVGGTFKVPTLRNVGLTAPYFHNGGMGTLEQVVDFYSRGGDVANAEKSVDLQPVGLSAQEQGELVAFLRALTDPRVRSQSAPFDHPQLFVPVGAQTRADGSVVTDAEGHAVDCFKEVAMTGAGGGRALADFPGFTGPPCDPVPTGAGGGPPDTAQPVAAVTVRVPGVTLPGRSCRSRRRVSVRVRAPRRDRIRQVIVAINGKRVRDLRGRRLTRAPVDLRGLPKGVVRVRIVVRTAKGHERLYVRTYRTCAAR